ncbi:hypothetical protein P7K49_034043 [Saguinus oedipus]|uniref:Uncharacterized protein n=1 Tax=Saguinus oedipus TaxID=9490 RepID=A0ABQ9TTM4_SAGOE|nr:hypothetical protein P7K49_034043 [Saguinus oedipus]
MQKRWICLDTPLHKPNSLLISYTEVELCKVSLTMAPGSQDNWEKKANTAVDSGIAFRLWVGIVIELLEDSEDLVYVVVKPAIPREKWRRISDSWVKCRQFQTEICHHSARAELESVFGMLENKRAQSEHG